jgi:hypothetical protein
MSIDEIWRNILKNEGNTFYTKTGIDFLYSVNGNSLYPKPSNGSTIFPITKTTLEDAMELMPLRNTVPLQKYKAPSYIYAILTDKRIV